jgi:hypothetical protein
MAKLPTGAPRHCCPFARTVTLAESGNETVFEAVDVNHSARAAPADAVESGNVLPNIGGETLIDVASTDVESAATASGVTDVAMTTAAVTAVTATEASAGRKRNMNVVTPSK